MKIRTLKVVFEMLNTLKQHHKIYLQKLFQIIRAVTYLNSIFQKNCLNQSIVSLILVASTIKQVYNEKYFFYLDPLCNIKSNKQKFFSMTV